MRFVTVTVIAKPVLRGRTQRNGGKGCGGRKTRKHASLFCLFVCLSKENCNWNCLIFKKKHSGLHRFVGGSAPHRVRLETAVLAVALRHHLGVWVRRAPVFLSSRERCAFVRVKYTSQCVFPPFLYNNYITYAFIHYELISASQRYTTKETINDIMWP